MQMPPIKKTILSLYYLIKKFSTSDTQILDLDPSNVTVEMVPLFNISPTDANAKSQEKQQINFQ